MMKRIFLFVLTNLLVMTTVGIVLSVLSAVFGIGRYQTGGGLDIGGLMVISLVWGMAGAFVSLLLSKVMAKWLMGVQVIDPNTNDPEARALVQTVHRLAQAAHLPKLPEVGVYQSPELNAFATGPTKGNALVAVSTGLLQQMNTAEVEGVLGHEITHIANGDMVTMTLIQGVINAFVMFFARIAAFAVANLMRGDDERGPSYMVQQLLVWVFQILFGILGSLVVCWFSRQREFRADKGGATLAGRQKMIGALAALGRGSEIEDNRAPAMAALKIADGHRLALMFRTHPPLEERIARLNAMT